MSDTAQYLAMAFKQLQTKTNETDTVHLHKVTLNKYTHEVWLEFHVEGEPLYLTINRDEQEAFAEASAQSEVLNSDN